MDAPTDPGHVVPQRPALDRWLPPSAWDENPTERLRQRLLLYFGPLIGAITLPWLVGLFLRDPVFRPPRLVAFIVLALLSASPLWLRVFSARRVAMLTVILFHIGVVVGLVANGGLSGPLALTVACLPIVTAVLVHSRLGWLDAALIFLAAAVHEAVQPEWTLEIVAPASTHSFLRLLALTVALGASLLVVNAYGSLARAQARTLSEIAHRDQLTGLFNRHHLQAVMPGEMATLARRRGRHRETPAASRPTLGFVLIDIDHFKQVNDRWGHGTGDAALQRVAEAVRTATRDSDIVVRWGGEEFLVVLRQLSSAHLADSPLRVLAAVRALELESSDGEYFRLTCSIGFTHFPEVDGDRPPTWEETLGLADRALALAKASGRDRAVGFVWPQPTTSADARIAMREPESTPDGVLERRLLL